MMKNVLVALGILSILCFGIEGISAQTVSVTGNNSAIVKLTPVTVDQARKIALKRVEGEIEDEYTIEEEDETVFAYVFKIRNTDKKLFEVQIEAESGEILYAEEDTY